ncbi:hypothetical protein V5O48_008020 [Marasmius crinis-equi]|uniref:CN hydrolase domain-containing protein n=1 Tax=Marasmius crinis-equi TaxID=585013 RepID=A0ABR3FF20_9AGAR
MKIAAIQAEPVWFNLDASVDKVIALAKEAASNGAQLVGFPEAFIPGYPMRLWSSGFDPAFSTRYLQNSLSVKSEQYQRLLRGVRDAKIWAVVGFVERDGDSMYCAQSIINPNGKVVLHRRKLKATGYERVIWGDAPADSLITSVEGPEGAIIGCLICGEHRQPLLRFHHYTQGVQIHVASWPFFGSTKDGTPPAFSSENATMFARCTASEGQMFVISSTHVMRPENAELCGVAGTVRDFKTGGGFAAIHGPDGRELAAFQDPMEEGILYADINLEARLTGKIISDSVGHYSRPDLLSLHVSAAINPLVRQQGKKEEEYTLLAKIPQLTGEEYEKENET